MIIRNYTYVWYQVTLSEGSCINCSSKISSSFFFRIFEVAGNVMRKNVELDLFINLCREILEKAWPSMAIVETFRVFPSFLVSEGSYDFIHVSFLILFACRSFGQQSKKWLLQLPSTGLMRAGPSFHRQPGALAEVDGSLDPFMFSRYWHISCRIHYRL